MTKADKTEIANLICNIRTMQSTADESKKTYLDEKIAKYAEDAMNDAKEVRHYIISSLQEHKTELLTDCFSNMRIGGDAFGYEQVDLLTKQKTVRFPITEFVSLLCNVSTYRIVKKCGFDEIWVNIPTESLTVEDIFIHTSDTTKRAYALRSRDFVYDTRGVSEGTFNFRGLRTSKGWNALYDMAKLTREKSEFFLNEYKKFLNAKISYFSTISKDYENAKESTKNIDPYEKVGL